MTVVNSQLHVYVYGSYHLKIISKKRAITNCKNTFSNELFRKFDFLLSLLFLCNFLKTACEKLLRKQLPNLKVWSAVTSFYRQICLVFKFLFLTLDCQSIYRVIDDITFYEPIFYSTYLVRISSYIWFEWIYVVFNRMLGTFFM